MPYKCISTVYDKLLSYIENDLFKQGCINNFVEYVERESKESIITERDTIYVTDSLISEEYILKYLKKSCCDFDAKDCVHIALNHVGVPPEDELSIESLAKTARAIMKEHKDRIYIKRTNGNVPTFCVDYKTALEVASHPDLVCLINTQTKKAEKKHKDTVDWRAYEFEKEKINYFDSMSTQRNNDEYYHSNPLTVDIKTYLMVKAIFNKLFSDFDFEKFEDYKTEMELLYDNWDFGKRYQELYDIFHAPQFNFEFYQEIEKNNLTDVIAEKVAEKIIKKLENH